MTDTTDIAALMLKMRNLADRIIDAEGENNNGEVGKIIEMYDAADTTFKAQNILLVLSAFEEQRQRADANAQEIKKLEFQWEHRAPTQWAYDQACTALHAQRERAEKSEAELAALKGDQVPVAWKLSDSPDTQDCTVTQSESVAKWWVEQGRNTTPLFTAPQKPGISKEKLCDWLEDNFDIDDSQRDAFAKCFAHHCNCIVKEGE